MNICQGRWWHNNPSRAGPGHDDLWLGAHTYGDTGGRPLFLFGHNGSRALLKQGSTLPLNCCEMLNVNGKTPTAVTAIPSTVQKKRPPKQTSVGRNFVIVYFVAECPAHIFTESAPLGQFSHRVAMSGCMFVCFFVEASHWP